LVALAALRRLDSTQDALSATWGKLVVHVLRAALIAATFAVLAPSAAMAVEEPRFKVIEQDGGFELRDYTSYVVAETRVTAGFDDAGSVAFKRLFQYISGNNVASQKIAMTAPVTQAKGEKIAMTAPVSQRAEGESYVVAFTLPSAYTLASAPRPRDPAVSLREIPAQRIAAWRYSGRWTVENYREHEALLRQRIQSRGLTASGPAVLARYNPPFTPWFLRRNEVLIPVGGKR
jgi:hypothetical protein